MKASPHNVLILIASLTALFSTRAASQPFPQAHAHNDYKHDRPLFDALRYGFTSVEADIYLIKGKLLVSHNHPFFDARTLDDLYLRPLDSILAANKGSVYPHYDEPFYLMIDLKSDGMAAYPVLKNAIRKYQSLSGSVQTHAHLVIFLSGNRPIETVMSDPDGWLALDGRPEDLGKGYPPVRMPVVSDTYHKWSDWDGHGKPRAGELQKIADLATRVHAEGRKLRLWAIPDSPDAWTALLDAGVDFINTDNLDGLNRFLKSRTKP